MKRSQRLRAIQWLCVSLSLACIDGATQAGESQKAIAQYVRGHWGAEKGFPRGPVYVITQTSDGYLWIGTEKGLVRFDGWNFRLFQQSNTTAGIRGPVLGLTANIHDDLWMRLQSGSLSRYHDGKFDDVSFGWEHPEVAVTAMCRGKDGQALFWGIVSGTFEYREGAFSKLASTPAGLNLLVISLAQMQDGRIWMGTRDTGLFQLRDGHVSPGPKGLLDSKINALLPSDNGVLWIGTDNGLVRWDGKKFLQNGLPPSLRRVQVFAITKDQESNTWVGTAEGLFRIAHAGSSRRDEKDPGSRGPVTAIYEDREGNIWTGSEQGLERLTDSAFETYSVEEGLPSQSNGPVYVDEEGRTWFAPLEGGLFWLKEGQVGRVTDSGLDRDVVYSIDGGKGELWIGRRRGGLTRLRFGGHSFITETYTRADGLAQNSVYAVHETRDGTVWAGTLSGGVSQFRNRSFKTYTNASGLGSNTVSSIAESLDGTMWFGTRNGLKALSKDQWFSYTTRDGLPSDEVNCLYEDSADVLWIGTARGLAYIRGGRISASWETLGMLREPILGVQEGLRGGLWIATANHVLRLDRDKLLQGAFESHDFREYGIADGLRSTEGVKRSRSIVRDQLGRIWISMNRGLSVIDPARVRARSVRAIVHIQGVSADGGALDLREPVRIPAATRRVTFSYVGLSLSEPERVRFKYKLDGFDRGWSEPVSAREATYTNLDSRRYRFRVIASNSDGSWNNAETTVQFEIAPVFWRTWWFELCAAAAIGMTVVVFFRLRMFRLTRQMNMRFEERLAERARIAQELQDTLLEGFSSASAQLRVAEEHLPPDSPAKPLVGRILEVTTQVIKEGQNAVQGMQPSKQNSPGLEQSFSQIRQEFPLQSQIGFRVIVEGTPQPLRPAIAEEVYRIGHEALSNAFRHSHAGDVEVELEYSRRHLRVLIRDNGVGIDPEVLHKGREGHWGLSGMKERAERVGGELRVLSRSDGGTEVELSVPSAIAFERQQAGRFTGRLFNLNRKKRQEEEPSSEGKEVR